ncbi:MAG TPA: MASE1 domain-containing protein [Chloroflexota bacterium]
MRSVLVLAALAAGYFLAGKAGLSLAFLNPSASPVWPPTGIAEAAVLVLGYRVWPAVLVGAFLVNFTTTGTIPTSLGVAVGNTLEAFTAAYLVRRWANGVHCFERAQEVLKFALFAGGVAPTLSATVGVATLWWGGLAEPGTLGQVWLTWWLGDLGGALVVGPVLVLWSLAPSWPGLRHAVEATLLTALLLWDGALVFTGLSPLGERRYPDAFLTFPILVWLALRLRPRGTATAVALLSVLAAWGTLQGNGPFAREGANESLILLQAFLSVAAVSSLALASAVAERRQTEAALSDTEETLRLAAQAEDDRARLIEAQASERLAQALLHERDEFLSIAAHELKTPVTSLRLFAQLLNRQLAAGELTPELVNRSAEVIDRQSQRLAGLIDQLLDISRIQAGRLDLTRATMDLTEMVSEIVDTTRLRVNDRALIFRGPAKALASVDGERLEQVVINLIENAIKYGPVGSPVEVTVRNGPDVTWDIRVRDQGPGIPLEHRPQIFDRFYQVEATPHNPGLGLGLFISREIVELHGGQLLAEFPPEGGSEFVVRLAALQETADHPESAAG